MIRPTAWHRLFRLGLLLKAVDGALEFAGGLALVFLSPQVINSAVWFLIRGELREDPKALLANLFLHATTDVAAAHVFAGTLLAVHGAVKVGLVAAIARNRRLAYPAAIGVFGAFVTYQSYQLTHRPSAFLWAVTITDVIFIVLVWQEYRWAFRNQLPRPAG